MEAQARNSRLDPNELRQFAIATEPYHCPRKATIVVDPRDDEQDETSMTTYELLTPEAEAKGILLGHDPNPNEGD